MRDEVNSFQSMLERIRKRFIHLVDLGQLVAADRLVPIGGFIYYHLVIEISGDS